MVTISDVAKEAKVSVATVSRVINGNNQVRKETAEKVISAIEKLSYEPNLLARNFRKSESKVILIITPNITNPYYSHILSGIGDTASRLGYSALIFNTEGKEHKEKEGMDMLKRKRADGAILLASTLGSKWILEYAKNYPLVLCSEYDEEILISRVSIDNLQATVEVMNYLLDLGHERIGTISATNAYISTQQRMTGFIDTLLTRGISPRPEHMGFAEKDYSFKSGKEVALKMLKQESPPTALFCISDTLALGALAAARELNIAVPNDLSITGFDNVEETTMFHPYITTISQPSRELGMWAMTLLYEKIKNKDEPIKTKILDYQFIIRESSKEVNSQVGSSRENLLIP